MQRRNRQRIWIAVVVCAAAAVAFWEYRQFRVPAISNPKPAEIVSMTGATPLTIEKPTWERVALADPHLRDDGEGIDVEVDGRHRFYPYQILVWHEIVNDTFRGKPLLVVYSPLARAGMAYDRRDAESIFAASNSVWNNVRLFMDQTSGSFWNPVLGKAIEGPRAGERLDAYPAHTMTWADWKIRYPNGEVLARIPDESRDYTLDPYTEYAKGPAIWFPLEFQDARFPTKEMVLGVEIEGKAAAYRLSDVSPTPVNDTISVEPVLVVYDPVFRVIRAFKRETSRGVDTFQLDEGELLDTETGSGWNFQGLAESGPLRRERLKELPATQAYWFSWVSVHPETQVYLP